MRDITKPGAIKDRILFRLNLFALDIKLQIHKSNEHNCFLFFFYLL